VPSKLAGLTIVTSELAADSDPGALQVVGDGLVRDLSVRLDSAFLGSSVQYGPSGLESLSGVQHVDGGSAFTDLDPFAEALSLAEVVGSSITAFVAHPDQLLALSTLKTASGYNTPLLQPDATSPTRRSILGVPIFWSPACSASTVWAIPASKVFTVIREGASVVTDTSAYFSSDRVGIRVTLRVGFAFPHEAAIVSIDLGGS
jgi:HK97 family phage major capsid protein